MKAKEEKVVKHAKDFAIIKDPHEEKVIETKILLLKKIVTRMKPKRK